jgi:hypothetical protein
MQSETKKQSIMRTWSGSAAVAFLALILCFASTGYGDVILGNWEAADDNDSFIPGPGDANAVLIPGSTNGVTLGSGSLKLLPSPTGDYWVLEWEGSPLDLTGASLSFDLSMVVDEFTSGGVWTKVADKIAINSDGPSGWYEWNNLAVATNRDTGEATGLDWGPWSPDDTNKTYTLDVSNYDATGATYMQIHISVQDTDLANSGYFYFDNFRLITPDMIVAKCKVKAGKTQYHGDEDYNDMKDTFEASGTVVLPPDINDVNEVEVAITSLTDDLVIYTETLSDFNATTVNAAGKYTHSARAIKGQAGIITYLKLDFVNGTFKINTKNLDLTGLACPLRLQFTLGSYELKGTANEIIVNGNTKTIPTRLMRLYDDKLVVTRAKAKHSTTPGYDSISVKGDIAVADINLDANEPNLCNEDVNFVWGDGDANTQTFTIPAGSFTASKKGHTYKCRKIITDANDCNAGIVTATIDLDKATYTVSVKNATGIYADLAGTAVFGINFATEEGIFDEEDDYTLP